MDYIPDIVENRYYFKETPFGKLMSKRVREILLVCSKYDKFMLEEDGRIDEQLFQEYVSLSLRYPPKFTQVSTSDEALKELEEKYFDLVIVMLSIGNSSALELASKIKELYQSKPIILLTPISTRETMLKLKTDDLNTIDYLFSWQGNSNIMLAMVKLIEDRLNVDFDTKAADVQVIILVEDSVRYYSSYLPMIYKTLFKQARNLMKEGLNEWQQTTRMRGRPKILLARNFEEALDLYRKYKNNILGIISDITYNKGGETDPDAGLKFCAYIRNEDGEMPILLQSSREEHRRRAYENKADFLYKHSKTLLRDLENYIRANYGFGDFAFRDPETLEPIGYAHDLRSLQRQLSQIPDESFAYHVRNNDISKWLKARALFSLASYLRPKQLDDFESIQATKEFIIKAIKNFRSHEGRGTIAEFNRNTFDELTFFSRIGSGSMGGKGRGLAFVDMLLKKNRIMYKYDDIVISIPRTIVVTTEIFDDFMEENNLHELALKDREDDKELLKIFLECKLPDKIREDLITIVEEIDKPLAVRSSSLLEDSQYQPFAGIYDTYMITNNSDQKEENLKALCKAIKSVYASTYTRRSKEYMTATNNIVEEEKMAVIIQEVTGTAYGDFYFPLISGVARSLNFYPIGNEKYKEGIANIALGLGKTVVDGGVSLRFAPKYPKKIIQLSDPGEALKNTQQEFYALNLKGKDFNPLEGEKGNLVHLPVKEAEGIYSFRYIASTYDFQNNRLRDGTAREGKKVVTFSGILKYNQFPLAGLLTELLEVGKNAMNVPIEIEFAVNIDTPEKKPKLFSLLQIRPIVEGFEGEDVEIEEEIPPHTILFSNRSMGNGSYYDLKDVVYIIPENFDASKTKIMAQTISSLNSKFSKTETGYILIVPGRLGSTDPWLGIPLSWTDISYAKVMVEAGMENFRVEPSQGTHFFQNITSLQTAYLTINPYLDDGIFNSTLLDSMDAVFENDYLRHVRFKEPLTVKVNGRTGKAIIYENL